MVNTMNEKTQSALNEIEFAIIESEQPIEDIFYNLYEFCDLNCLLEEYKQLEKSVVKQEMIDQAKNDNIEGHKVPRNGYKIHLRPSEIDDLIVEYIKNNSNEVGDSL